MGLGRQGYLKAEEEDGREAAITKHLPSHPTPSPTLYHLLLFLHELLYPHILLPKLYHPRPSDPKDCLHILSVLLLHPHDFLPLHPSYLSPSTSIPSTPLPSTPLPPSPSILFFPSFPSYTTPQMHSHSSLKTLTRCMSHRHRCHSHHYYHHYHYNCYHRYLHQDHRQQCHYQ